MTGWTSIALVTVLMGVAIVTTVDSILLVDTTGTLTATALTITTAAVSTEVLAAAVATAGALVLGAAAMAAVAGLASEGRKKRETKACMPIENPDIFFLLAKDSDKFGCGLKLVCELEATPDDHLQDDEKLILGLFGRNPSPPNFGELKTPKATFQYAAYVGSKATNASECGQLFKECPFGSKAIMSALKKNSL